ncbi:MAG: FkbM family methyltransferase [Thalassobaculaceae bacterium]
MPSPSQAPESGPELTDSVAAVLSTPGEAFALLRLSAHLSATPERQAGGAPRAYAAPLAWFSAAACCSGPTGRTLAARNAGLLTRLIHGAPASPRRSAALDRVCRLFPGQPEFWLLAATERSGDGAEERKALRRALVLAPERPRPWIRLAVSRFRDGAVDTARAVAPARRAATIAPALSDAHRVLAGMLLDGLEIDVPAPALLRNSLRRWALLEADPAGARPALEGALRKAGDVDALIRVGAWARLRQAASGQGTYDRGPGAALDAFAAEIAGLAPLRLDTEFEARVFADRVLLHPKLPNNGVWRLHGPTDQCERAARVLRHYNPEATVLAPDAPGTEEQGSEGRTLAVVPCDDPEAWYLPCLWGHPHIWWTVLPAILDPAAAPDLDRALSFGLRTGQNVTFWTGDAKARAHIAANAERGRRIADRLGDAASRHGYLETMAADRPTFLRRFFTEAGHRAQYFDYAVYRPGDVILSMGVAEGFEIPAYLSLIAPGGVLHNIDPDGHGRLGAPARAWIDPAWLERTGCAVHVHPVAISDVDGEIRMQTGGHWEDSRLSRRPADQMTTLASKRLDTLVAEQRLDKIDHIKLDIEGGEGFVLDQVIAVMNSHRPQIEISIYHTPEQFFDIPERMMAETEGYRFFFHHYSGQFAEATLYAIPEEIEPLMPIKP